MRILAPFFLLVSMFSASVQATESATGFLCAEDAGGVGSCTANEISIANVTNIQIDGNPTSCNEGDPVLITNVDVEFNLNTGERYDPLLWIGEQANDPRASGGTCFVSSIPTPADSIFQHLEGASNDSCLDVNNPAGTPQTKTFANITIECRDADGDNEADMQAIVSWHQNVATACGEPGDVPGETFAPGAPSKCDYSIIPLGIEFVQESFLTLIKDVSNNNGGQAIPSDFDLVLTGTDGTHDAGLTYKSGNNPSISTGIEYTVSEPSQPQGYQLDMIECRDDEDDSIIGMGGVFTAEDDQHITCTVFNSDIGSTLTLVKVLPNDNGGTATEDDFQASISGIGDVDWDAATPISAGDYTVSETTLPGYAASDWSGDCAADGSITVGLDQALTCTITNDDVAPTLTLLKSLPNDNGGTATEDDFQASISGVGDVDWSVATPLDAGDYTASETTLPGYTPSSWSGDCNADGTISLAPGENLTCTITNDDVAPTLTLTKTVINDDGGTADEDDFQAWITDLPVDWDTPVPVNAGPTFVSESNHAGYTASAWGGDCNPDGTITLSPGQNATCSITNDDILVRPVPTMGQWATMLLVLMLIATGWYFRPRRVN